MLGPGVKQCCRQQREDALYLLLAAVVLEPILATASDHG